MEGDEAAGRVLVREGVDTRRIKGDSPSYEIKGGLIKVNHNLTVPNYSK